ncbi:alpha/beta fold hydrolase [Candidatus Gracilibacteria bacterium]|nr:alpha/beta fold hydrolase [Candidatus Gracilibacteria bacterium]
MSILHVSDYFSNVQKHVPHMLSQEGIDLMHYMRANLKGKLHPPTDSFREETDKLFFLIPGFLSSNGTLGVIGKTLEKAGSIFYAPDLPYLNTGPVEEKLELLYAKFTNIMQAHPDKKLILIGHSMGGLLAEEVARMYYTETKQKVHQIIPIGTPHGIPEIAKLVKNIIPSGGYLTSSESRKHTNELGAIMQTTHHFSPQITRRDGLVHPDAQVPRGSENIQRTQIHSPHQIEGTEGIRDHLWANHTNITGSIPFARSLAYH